MTAQPIELDPTTEALAAAALVAVQDPDRQAAEITALEAVIVVAVLARLRPQLDGITTTLRTAFTASAVAAPVAWALARRRAAVALRTTRVDLARPLERLLPRAVELGARFVGGPVPAGFDPRADDVTREWLASLDADVRAKLARAAADLLAGPVRTPAQMAAVEARIDAARKAAEAGVGDVVARTVATATAAVADELGVALAWRAEPGACTSCRGMDGALREPGGRFFPVLPGLVRMVWLLAGVAAPPAHQHCRCTAVVAAGVAPHPTRRTRLAGLAASGLRALDRALRRRTQTARGRTGR